MPKNVTQTHTVSTDALGSLGTIISGKNEVRDAIHLAVEPVEAGEKLYPGQDIGIVDGKAYTTAPKKVGIVDPFIGNPVYEGQHFWLVVYPRKITSLRHVWSHPDFPEIQPKEVIKEVVPKDYETLKAAEKKRLEEEEYKKTEVGKAETWIRRYADRLGDSGVDYDELMNTARRVAAGDDYAYLTVYGEETYIDPEFWDHFETVTGVHPENRANFFSCSC